MGKHAGPPPGAPHPFPARAHRGGVHITPPPVLVVRLARGLLLLAGLELLLLAGLDLRLLLELRLLLAGLVSISEQVSYGSLHIAFQN